MTQKEILRNLIIYFTYKIRNLSKTKLIKLIYLSDLEHYKRHRTTISGVEFISFHYGPWNPEIEGFIEKECGDTVKIEMIETNEGEIIKINKPRIRETSVKFPSAEIFETLERVRADWGRKTLAEIITYIKQNNPYLETEKGDPLDFMLVDSDFKESINTASHQARCKGIIKKSLDEL